MIGAPAPDIWKYKPEHPRAAFSPGSAVLTQNALDSSSDRATLMAFFAFFCGIRGVWGSTD